jgi:hypothetical protein
MKAITLRKIPPKLARIIQKTAREKKMSINRTIITLLDREMERPEQKKAEYHDLDDLAGSWSKGEAEAFDKSLAKQRAIDPDLWK